MICQILTIIAGIRGDSSALPAEIRRSARRFFKGDEVLVGGTSFGPELAGRVALAVVVRDNLDGTIEVEGNDVESSAVPQEAKNKPNIPLQDKFRRVVLRALRINISDTPKKRYEISPGKGK